MTKNPPFPKGINPRSYLPHRERGVKRFYYTYKDIATALDRSVQTIKNLNATGKLDPNSLKSIIDNHNKRYCVMIENKPKWG